MLDTPYAWCIIRGMKGANMKYEEAFANLLNDLWTEGQKLPVENIHAHDEYSEWADCKNCNPCYEEDK